MEYTTTNPWAMGFTHVGYGDLGEVGMPTYPLMAYAPEGSDWGASATVSVVDPALSRRRKQLLDKMKKLQKQLRAAQKKRNIKRVQQLSNLIRQTAQQLQNINARIEQSKRAAKSRKIQLKKPPARRRRPRRLPRRRGLPPRRRSGPVLQMLAQAKQRRRQQLMAQGMAPATATQMAETQVEASYAASPQTYETAAAAPVEMPISSAMYTPSAPAPYIEPHYATDSPYTSAEIGPEDTDLEDFEEEEEGFLTRVMGDFDMAMAVRVLLIGGVIAGAAYFVWQKQKQKKKTRKPAAE